MNKHYCLDCNKLLGDLSGKSIRCKSCSQKGKLGHRYGIKIFGKDAPNWKGGRPKCLDCDKLVSRREFKRCKLCARKFQKGENSSNWKGGLNSIVYPVIWTEALKEKIRKRDNEVCQNCNKSQVLELKTNKRKLHIHHIDYNKHNCSENNLITLCNVCNLKANFNREMWKTKYIKKNLIWNQNINIL
jgi:hypothetical protein